MYGVIKQSYYAKLFENVKLFESCIKEEIEDVYVLIWYYKTVLIERLVICAPHDISYTVLLCGYYWGFVVCIGRYGALAEWFNALVLKTRVD